MPGFSIVSSGADRCRVVITGLGVVSPLGRTVESFWRALLRPHAADSRDSLSNGGAARRPGEADFSGRIEEFGDLPEAQRKAIRKSLKLMNRETQLGVAAGQQALASSGLLEVDSRVREQVGVCFGADNVAILPEDFEAGIRACLGAEGRLEIQRWGSTGLPEVDPLWLLKCLPNMPACHLAIINDLQGPSNTITQRDVSANLAVAEATRTIQCGDAPAMLVGASGTTLTALNRMHARLQGELDDATETTVCRPFDRNRSAPGPGEGAAAMVLEDLESARRRGAPIYGEILASGSASRIGAAGATNWTAGLEQAMSQALSRARLSRESVGHIHAHGLGTEASDTAEALAIRSVFGKRRPAAPVVAAKSRLCHAGAGAGALELVASVLALQHGELFPAVHCDEIDPDCPVRLVRERGVAAGASFLKLSLSSRGLASCVVVGRYAA